MSQQPHQPTEIVSRQAIEEFTAWVKLDVRNRASPEQQQALRATPESCRRWVSTLRLLIEETASDIEIRERENVGLEKSAILQDRTRYTEHLIWVRKTKKFRVYCQERLQEAEGVLRAVTGLAVTAERLVLAAAEIIPADHAWHQEFRVYQINRLGNLGPGEPSPSKE